MYKKAALHNLGCKVNAYETEVMQQQLEAAGYTVVSFDETADIYIINTCSVTNMADKKSRQMIHRARKLNPDAVVAACGCYVQALGDNARTELGLDLVIGNNRKKDLVMILEEYFKKLQPETYMIDINHTGEYEEMSLSSTAEHTRAYIKVQDGCNQFCSYCIIPYVRGRVRSRDPEDVKREVCGLIEKGYQEFVLTGIHLSSYGIDLSEDKSPKLLDLIRMLDSIQGVKRLRLGSLEPRIITEDFAESLAGMESICPHFHLSLQSGCDETLRRMNRRYSASEYKEKCQILRKAFSDPALTTDVIVGFPQESEEEFAACEAFLKDIAFSETHIFKYSRRQGTRAAAMPGQIPENVKTQRSHVLLTLNDKNQTDYLMRHIGKPLEVLFEEIIEVDGENYYTGYSREYIRVLIKTQEDLENQIRQVTCDKMLESRGEKFLVALS